MTLLERFRTQPPQKHADPLVRLAHVGEIPLDDRIAIAAIAREDEDPRVRRAAVAKLLDSAALGAVAAGDSDETVREAAVLMLRDIALEAFEGIGEADSVAAVDALVDSKALGTVAKNATRDEVARRALSRINDVHTLGSIARHAVTEAARRGAFEALERRADYGEILAVAMNSEYKDTALSAVDLVEARGELEQIAERGKNKSAAKRARTILRDRDDQAEREAREAAENSASLSVSANHDLASDAPAAAVPIPSVEADQLAQQRDDEAARLREEQEAERARTAAEEEARGRERRLARLAEIADEAAAAASDPDLAAARKRFARVGREWKDTGAGVDLGLELAARYAESERLLNTRDAEAREADARARREALQRVQHLLDRVEPLSSKSDLTLRAADRALRDVRTQLASIPPLPSKQDYDDISHRLKAMHVALVGKVKELREAEEWQRWANAGVQEELCAKMEALAALEDPEAIAREVRELQQRWREVADVPRAQADVLWRRFKTAHDAVWPRCEAHFAAEAQARAENLARKTALCEQAESMADSTSWIQTADAIKRLQAEWKTIGPVSRGREKAVWDRFRAACDRFFTRRRDDLIARKTIWTENFAKKEALCVRAEELAQSTDWENAAAEIRRLQATWKTIGPVKKSRSEAVWQRFRGACDQFFARYAHRHDEARAERVAARETICAELEALAAASSEPSPGGTPAAHNLQTTVRSLRAKWQQEIAGRGLDPDRARAFDQRFAAALASVVSRWPDVFGGTDLDPDANRKRLDALARRMEELAASLGGTAPAIDPSLSPTTRLAAMLKEALAANTIGGKVDDDSRFRAALEEVRHAQSQWTRVGPVAEDARRPLADRFQRACRLVMERVNAKSGAAAR